MFIQFLKDWGALIVAGISLVVAIISFLRSSKSQKLQDKVNSHEVKIKQYELEKIENEEKNKSFSCVEARAIRASESNYFLKIWNSGNTTVYNVSASINKESNIFLFKEKMPFEILEPMKGFDAILVIHMSSAPKFTVTTEWEDDKGTKHSKSQLCDY